ncbi:hypothetical protein CDAR_558131 [Caerostris darwini]|uniref:Uncharacterized protein n=1 Tax=Caerostris darwini TaxID=1538125 RepID=A0AAV4R9E5_9ARAC|nr:hypothetical protein CDAR_558131 [Caerostris darwini]
MVTRVLFINMKLPFYPSHLSQEKMRPGITYMTSLLCGSLSVMRICEEVPLRVRIRVRQRVEVAFKWTDKAKQRSSQIVKLCSQRTLLLP